VTLKKGIKFCDVTFRYPTAPEGAKNILEKGNFTIKAEKNTAIIGPSGAGKSTIVQMIERFYDPFQGEILFDDEKISNLSLRALRESIGYVS